MATKKRNRWTEAQVKMLQKNVKSSPTAKAGIEITAEALGKSYGTVQQKYYALQRGSKPAKPKGKVKTVRAVRAPQKQGLVAIAQQLESARAEVARLEGLLRAAV